MNVEIKVNLNDGIFLKDPQDSKLGRKILKYSVLLINELGFEYFNFKKLAERIGSVEASIYRYFKNKNRLLLYLTAWYWNRCEYLIKSNLVNLEDPKRKMQVIIKFLMYLQEESLSASSYIDERVLHNVIVSEGVKSYRSINITKENSHGFFMGYKNLTKTITQIILEINPEFRYPRSLASNLVEMSGNYIYFTKHLPRLTDFELKDDKVPTEDIEEMLNCFVNRLLE